MIYNHIPICDAQFNIIYSKYNRENTRILDNVTFKLEYIFIHFSYYKSFLVWELE